MEKEEEIKERKGKKYKLESEMCIEDRLGKGCNYCEIQTDFFQNLISPSFKITTIRK